jgi:beta-lactamase regulating signal transducer with metallopeptidase domain
VVCVQWFNPLVYILKRELELAFELSNDQVVIKECSPEQEIAYAECIHKVARGLSDTRKDFGVSFIGSSKKVLETRIDMILKEDSKKPDQRYVMGHCLIVSTMFLIALFLTPEAYVQKEKENYFDINSGNSYIIESDRGYQIFVDGIYAFNVSFIPEDFSDLPIVEEETER